MKRVLLLMVMLAVVMCSYAMAEVSHPEIVGSWGTDGVTLRVLQHGDEYRVLKNAGDGEYGWSRAAYNECVYDEEGNRLLCTGIMETCVEEPETEEDEEESEGLYRMVREESWLPLTIGEDGIMAYPDWEGEPIQLLYYGPFEGTWKDGNLTIEFHFGDTELWCEIKEDDEIKWTYRCDYDEDRDKPYEHFYGSRRDEDQEEELEAIFSVDSDGRLIWNDLTENMGEGMAFIRQEGPRDERIHDFYSYEPGDGKAYEVFVITKLLYDENHQVTDVTGQFAHMTDNGESSDWELAEDGGFYTYHLAEDFSADLRASLYDASMETVTDLHEWYIRVCLEEEEPQNGELYFLTHMSEEERRNADRDLCFDCIAVRVELNEANEIRYMCYKRVPWIM